MTWNELLEKIDIIVVDDLKKKYNDQITADDIEDLITRLKTVKYNLKNMTCPADSGSVASNDG